MSVKEEPRNSLFRNTGIMALGSILSRVTGVGKIIALALVIGQSSSPFPDAYNLANNIPNIAYELIVGGILSATLVPVFVQRFTRLDEETAWHAVSAVFTVSAVALAALAAGLLVAAPWVIDLYTILRQDDVADDQREVATFLLRLFVPQVIFYGFITLATGLLHARRLFGPPMFAPLFNNLVMIFVLLAFGAIWDDVSLEAMKQDRAALTFLGLGTTAGVLSMALVLVPYFRRAGAAEHLSWRFEPRHEAVRTVVRLSGWAAGLTVATQVSMAVMLALAFKIGGGAYTAFVSGLIFFILPHGILTVSLISAMQPEWATRWGHSDREGFRKEVSKGLRLVVFLIIPVAVGYILLAQPLIEAILVRGKFTSQDAELLSTVVSWMVIGLPGLSVFVYLTRAFQSMPDARTVFFLYLVQSLVVVVSAIGLQHFGVKGIAAAQSTGYILGAILALFALRSRMGGVEARRLLSTVLRVSIAAAVMGWVIHLAVGAVPQNVYLELVVAILAGAAVYLAAARLLRLEETHFLLRRR